MIIWLKKFVVLVRRMNVLIVGIIGLERNWNKLGNDWFGGLVIGLLEVVVM